eukprot:scaffold5379_cov58-Phaeocystis_antarctica.AAC.2
MAQKGKGKSAAHTACVCGPARECGQKPQAEAHLEHPAHVCDAGGIPFGNVNVEIPQALEEVARVRDL